MSKSRYRQRFTDDEMEMLFREDATNEEIEAKVSSPRYWTYIVRHPNGFVVCHGRGRSRQTCERNAVRLAGQFAEELFWADGAGRLAAGALCYGRRGSQPSTAET